MEYYQLDIDQVLESLKTSRRGLSSTEGRTRLNEYGPNEITEKKKKPAWMIFINQFRDFMILVLVAAAIVSGIAGDTTDAIIIVVIVILNAIVGFIQEYRAEKAIEALRKMAAIQAHLMRDEEVVMLPASELVPGDLVILEAGNVVPADLRLIESHSLRIDESTLTGESVAVEKDPDLVIDKEVSLGDRFNVSYKGTLVTNGRGMGIVTTTGMATEFGKIAGMLQGAEPITPLQKRMTDFGRKLSYLILCICVLLFIAGLLRGEKPLPMLLLSISLAVAAIPEALPALITIALAMGARRLVKKNALIRKLPAVETLGSVSFICSDKTGTLTQNKMKLVQLEETGIMNFSYENIPALHLAMALNHDVDNSGQTMQGDPTEIAIVEYFFNQYSPDDLFRIQKQLPRVAEIPFDSDRKAMTTIHKFDQKFLVITKGAVESITKMLADKSQVPSLLQKAEKMAADGTRVLAYAFKFIGKINQPLISEEIESELQFAGLTGMIDPPRMEAAKAVEECKTAGIRVVMITGDHPATASAIAKQIGILGDHDLVLNGGELQLMNLQTYQDQVEKYRVYARVSPEQKLNIVKALQGKKHFVAMTGDGVNDAPSLKTADIGVAMGINGTDVSKEAAHMILLDDNFATIVVAVKEGRRIFDNIRKFVKYIMTCNGAEIWTIFLAPLIGLPIPLLPIHILWINLVTDGLPGLALAGEKAESDIMKRPPRRSDESLFSGGIGYHIAWVGLLMAGVTLGLQAWTIHHKFEHWQTMVFTVLSLTQVGHVLSIRSDHEFFYSKNIFSNKPLIGSVILTLILQMTVIYLPAANDLFKTNPLSLKELAICFVASGIVLHAVEIEKFIKLKIRTSNPPTLASAGKASN